MNNKYKQYDRWMHALVVTALQEGASTCRAVVARCNGADPLIVSRALGNIYGSANMPFPMEMSAPPRGDDGPVEPHLPVPHPLDFEWRFSRRGAKSLLDAARRLGGGDLLLLAATTVAIVATRLGWGGRIVAIDQSQVLLAAAKAYAASADFVASDVSASPILNQAANVVIMDPPWYPEYAASFFYAASVACRPGGYILACVPGEGTRPGIRRERAALATMLRGQGLVSESLRPQLIDYETPHFERNAFLAAGLPGDHRRWRRGDLWILRKTGTGRAQALQMSVNREMWQEVTISGTRARFLTGQARSGDAALSSIVEGDILPTVSRRDPRRAAVRVWTSGNRVFSCNDPDTLLAAVRARAKSQDPIVAAARVLGRCPTAAEQEAINESCCRLLELCAREQDERATDEARERKFKGLSGRRDSAPVVC